MLEDRRSDFVLSEAGFRRASLTLSSQPALSSGKTGSRRLEAKWDAGSCRKVTSTPLQPPSGLHSEVHSRGPPPWWPALVTDAWTSRCNRTRSWPLVQSGEHSAQRCRTDTVPLTWLKGKHHALRVQYFSRTKKCTDRTVGQCPRESVSGQAQL